MTKFTVVVGGRTYQTFVVEAASAQGAKRKITAWMNGTRDDAKDDLLVMDDVGQEFFRDPTRKWKVEENDD